MNPSMIMSYLSDLDCNSNVEVKSDGLRFPRSVQYFKTAESEGGYHKTQKPVALLEYLKSLSSVVLVVIQPSR